MALEVYGFPFGGAPAPFVWSPLVAADFISTSVYLDPNGIVNNPISIHASDGSITFDLNEPGVARDGIAEGAVWRLRWPSGWLGDGTQALVWRVTPLTNPGVTSIPFVGIGYSDQRGNPADPTPARTQMSGAGYADALNIGSARATNTSGFGALYPAPFANGPAWYGWFMPGGAVGDTSNIGIQPAVGGSNGGVLWDPVVPGTTGTLGASDAGTIIDGIYPLLVACFDGTGVGTVQFTMRFEWALTYIVPPNEYA